MWPSSFALVKVKSSASQSDATGFEHLPMGSLTHPRRKYLWPGSRSLSEYSATWRVQTEQNQQLLHFFLQLLLLLVHPAVAHGFVFAGVGLHLRPVQRDLAQLDRPALQRQR